MKPALTLIAAALLAGCFSPSYVNGSLKCEAGTNACPDGYRCAEDGTCWRNGTGPDLSDSNNMPGDLGESPDLEPSGKANAAACAMDDECASGHCVDGVCCNSACTGQCEACDTASTGTCSPVQGPPHGTRTACAGAGTTCGGMCDGNNGMACSYPATSQICGAACDSHCDGAGTCPSGSGSCPNGYACGSGNCKTSCANNNDCQPNFMCAAPNCVRIPESDCLDGLDNNGDGKIDCDDPSCTAQVECVATPGTGNEIGLMNQSACSATGYGNKEPQNQGLSIPSCTGCSCSSSVVCNEAVRLYFTNDSTCASNNYIGYSVHDYFGPVACVPVNPTTYYDYYLNNKTLLSSSCAPAGSATLADSTWTTSTNFCAATRVSTNNCAGNPAKICVAKPPASTNLCVRVPGSGGCPAGYTGTSSTYYANYQKGSCGSCSGCSQLSASCDGIEGILFFTDANCQNSDWGASYSDGGPACSSSSTGFTHFPHAYGSIAMSGAGGTSNVTCSSASVTTNPSTPTGASTICCP